MKCNVGITLKLKKCIKIIIIKKEPKSSSVLFTKKRKVALCIIVLYVHKIVQTTVFIVHSPARSGRRGLATKGPLVA